MSVFTGSVHKAGAGLFLREFPRPVFCRGPAGISCPAGIPAPCRAAHVAKIGLAGFPAPPSLRDTPRSAPPPALHFLFIGLSGRSRATYWPGWLCGYLFDIFSLHRCSFVTERTKGPAVSMRRPPTRGPRDPWTPRTMALRGCLYAPNPRRPTLDGPAHTVRLHIGTHRPLFKALPTFRATPRPAPPLALPKLA